jgi:hypothetical protein
MKLMKNKTTLGAIILAVALIVGQGLAYLLNPAGYLTFGQALPLVLSQIAFWGPIIAMIAGGFILITFRLLGFTSLDEIRTESVEQNNPAPAIVFVGTLIASLLFLGLVIRP